MTRDLREVWRIRCQHLQDKVIASAKYAESERARLDAAGWNPTLERLPLLTPEDAAVLAAAEAYVTEDPSDPWGYQKDAQHDALRDAVMARRAARVAQEGGR